LNIAVCFINKVSQGFDDLSFSLAMLVVWRPAAAGASDFLGCEFFVIL